MIFQAGETILKPLKVIRDIPDCNIYDSKAFSCWHLKKVS